ncbi:hypothetical protein Patl1_01349 [Pistacia atlantica]|uniref:Uncharacterized protein n=1 Tax=Pistacia atlantica TaxID=434234 RepID=A0ACC1C8L9_9ROSI|nr:hypothetical protein Patl1_01349 [Pistacia atlantica]
MLKIPDHQVAGHQARDGKLGPLIDDSGRFYKPLQDDERGSNEAAFYTSFSSNTKIPDHIHRFFPVFYGTQLLEASDGSGLRPHLVLEDLVSKHLNPSIIDIKIGSRTWYPEASEDYIQRCLKKDAETTSLLLGFRISGIADIFPDCSFAPTVYGGSTGILAQLLELKAWSSGAEIKLVDFAHVVEGKGIIDHNFLGGLCSFIKFVSEILTSPNELSTKASSQDSENKCSFTENGSSE